MSPTRSFSQRVLNALDEAKILGIRAGLEPHRFLGIWVVVIGRRVFVRPWNDKPNGWYRKFLEQPRGAIQIGEHEIPIRTRMIKSERLMDAVDHAYAEKYHTPGSRKWVRGFKLKRRRATTTELLPR